MIQNNLIRSADFITDNPDSALKTKLESIDRYVDICVEDRPNSFLTQDIFEESGIVKMYYTKNRFELCPVKCKVYKDSDYN